MLNRAWIEREAPLKRCPVRSCRRDGVCRHPTENDPCRRLHETKDQARNALADKLQRMKREIIAKRPPGTVVPVAKQGTPEFERRLKALYDALREAEEEHTARELAAARAKGKPAGIQKEDA